MARYALIDGKPVPKRYEASIRRLKIASGATLNSCLRSQRAVNWARSQGASLQSQKELYDGFQKHLPGYNPANPPGRSTHECRSDGVAYRGPIGRVLFFWQVGMDWSNSDAVRAAASREGMHVFRPYADGREYHHLNFVQAPKPGGSTVQRALRLGSKGIRVYVLTRRLCFVKDPDNHKPYLKEKSRHYTERVESAVREYQRDHGLKADGVFGKATGRALSASVRWWKRHYREKK